MFTFVSMQKILVKFLVDTNLWVSICFASFVLFFQLGLYQLNWPVIGIAFFGTLAIYNFTRIGSSLTSVQSKNNFAEHFTLTIIGLLGTFICLLVRGFNFETFIYLANLGLLSFLYSLPFTTFGLRTVPVLKLFLIALVWTGSSLGLLLVVHDQVIQYEKLLFSVFLFIVGITIPFDIRDEKDDEEELRTIPQLIGIANSKVLAIISLIASALLFYLEFQTFNALVISWIATIFISILFVLFATSKRSHFYYAFWVESCSLLPLLFFLFQQL